MRWLTPPYAPRHTDDAMRAFPAEVWAYVPDPATIPEQGTYGDWDDLAYLWFFEGLPEDVEFWLKDDLDGETAYHHISCVIRSYAQSHQDKMAAVAFLLQTWMEKVVLPSKPKTYTSKS